MIQYIIYYDYYRTTHVLWDSLDPESNPIISGSLEMEVGNSYKLDLSIPITNTNASNINIYRTKIIVEKKYLSNDQNQVFDSVIIFYGRVCNIEKDVIGNLSVTCEDSLSILKTLYAPPSILVASYELTNYELLEAVIHRLFGIETYQKALGFADGDALKIYGYYYEVGEIDCPRGISFQYKDIADSVDTYGDPIPIYDCMTKLVDIVGGFFSPRYEVYHVDQDYSYDTITTYMDYYAYEGNLGIPDIVNFTDEFVDEEMDEIGIADEDYQDAYDVSENQKLIYPIYEYGINVIEYSSEPSVSLENMYSGIVPVGKGENGEEYYITDVHGNYICAIWYSDLVSKFGYRQKLLVFDNITAEAELSDKVNKYYEHMLKVSSLNRYRINCIEAVESYKGYVLTKLMHNVKLIIEKDDVELIAPVLSMKVDFLNPLVFECVVGPYIPNNYLDESIIK